MKLLLTRLYERNRRTYVYGCVALIAAEVLLVTIPVGMAFAARYEGLSFGRFLSTTAIIEAVAAPIQVLAVLLVGSQVRLFLGWARGPQPEAAPEVIRAVHNLPRRAVLRVAAAYATVFPPVVVLVFSWTVHAIAFPDILFLGIGTVVIVLYGAQLTWYTLELATAPMVAEASSSAPDGNRITSRSVSVTTRLLSGVFMAGVGGGALVSLVDGRFAAGGGAGLRMLAVSVAVATVFGAVFIAAAVLTVLEPTRDLIRGAQAVRVGELDVQVPVSNADELGELAQSFNEMVEGLRERERLQRDNDQLIRELRASRERLVTLADEERRRLERDLHDGAQQRLVLLGLRVGALPKLIADDPARAAGAVEELAADIRMALNELRDLAHGIYPALLENDGLAGALPDAAKRAAIPTTVEVDGAGRYAPELEAAVYFCCLEALQNAGKHAGSEARANIKLTADDDTLGFEVADDGAGFDPATTAHSSGLQNIADRIGALGGAVQIRSSPGDGTIIAGHIPTSPH